MHLRGRPLTPTIAVADGFVATLDATALARSYERDIPGARPGEYDDIAMMNAAGPANITLRMLNVDLLLQRCVGHADDEGDCKGTRVHRRLQVQLTNGLFGLLKSVSTMSRKMRIAFISPANQPLLKKITGPRTRNRNTKLC